MGTLSTKPLPHEPIQKRHGMQCRHCRRKFTTTELYLDKKADGTLFIRPLTDEACTARPSKHDEDSAYGHDQDAINDAKSEKQTRPLRPEKARSKKRHKTAT